MSEPVMSPRWRQIRCPERPIPDGQARADRKAIGTRCGLARCVPAGDNRLQLQRSQSPRRTGPMTFDPNVQLDPTQVTDVRGRSAGGRGGGLAIGGGGLGLVIAIIYILLGGNPGDLISSGGSGTAPDINAPNSSALAEGTTGAAANAPEDRLIV